MFGSPLRRDILQRCVEYHRAKRRKGFFSTTLIFLYLFLTFKWVFVVGPGTFKAKDRSEVSGSGKKMWRQKGTGRARVGDKRPPHWRGGGVAHGPVVRAFEKGLQKKVARCFIVLSNTCCVFERWLVG